MLIKCIECGREISDRAAACTNCGMPLDDRVIYLGRELVLAEAARIRASIESEERLRYGIHTAQTWSSM